MNEHKKINAGSRGGLWVLGHALEVYCRVPGDSSLLWAPRPLSEGFSSGSSCSIRMRCLSPGLRAKQPSSIVGQNLQSRELKLSLLVVSGIFIVTGRWYNVQFRVQSENILWLWPADDSQVTWTNSGYVLRARSLSYYAAVLCADRPEAAFLLLGCANTLCTGFLGLL